MIDVEVILAGASAEEVPGRARTRALCVRAARAAGVRDGHLAIEFVGPERIRELNRDHRGIDRPTDVLSFPVDGPGPTEGPRELGDVIVCPQHTADLDEAIVHGVLHLAGLDHEADSGEMLELQDRVLRQARGEGA